jgi:hypothetical protein
LALPQRALAAKDRLSEQLIDRFPLYGNRVRHLVALFHRPTLALAACAKGVSKIAAGFVVLI